MQDDLYEPLAGIRTLSTTSRHYDPLGYHNGSIWPHDSGMIAEGMEQFGFTEEADKIRTAIAHAIRTFGTPIELVTVIDGTLTQGSSESRQRACQVQAWTAATLLAEM
jgi:glycogen debranching enzyme